MNEKESGIDQENAGVEEVAEQAVSGAAQALATKLGGLFMKFIGKYILIAVIAVWLIGMLIVILMLPALALGEVATGLYESLFGSGGDEAATFTASEEYWYDPQNVLDNIDAMFEQLSNVDDGMTYVTKDNFKTILNKVIEYNGSIRNVDNSYKYYHHIYKTVVTGFREEIIEDDSGGGTVNGNDIPSQGVTNDASTTYEVKSDSYVGTDGKWRDMYTQYSVTDIEETDPVGHINNKSPEDDPMFRVSWEEIYTAAAMKSVTMDARQTNWETTVSENDTGQPTLVADARLDEATINSIIYSFEYSIGYYFDPTSTDPIPNGGGDTYANHVYSYEEMDNYAYIESESGTNVEHGTEVQGQTADFEYYKYKKPAIAPAIAKNAYTVIEYDYTENGDGTATLAGRQITVNGQSFYNSMRAIMGEDFDLRWYVEFIMKLPGVSYDAGSGSIATRFQKILESYESGEPISYYDTNIPGVGEVKLGPGCDRSNIQYSTRVDGNGNPVPPPRAELNITVNDISDEQIRADIAAGLYSLEDLVYLAACIQSEAYQDIPGQVAVAWCVRNRMENLTGKWHYSSYKEAITAPDQFAGEWYLYLDGSYTKQCETVAAGVLRGDIANPIPTCYYFFSDWYVKSYRPGAYFINIGGNVFYEEFGDVTSKTPDGYILF